MIIINVEWNLYYGMVTYRLLLGGVKQAPHTSDITTFHPHYANVYVTDIRERDSTLYVCRDDL